MGNLMHGSMMVEGRIARLVYLSLYRMHQVALHGYFRTGLMMLSGSINKVIRTLCLQNAEHSEAWIEAYANAFALESTQLRSQVKRWRPWLLLLQASWFQLRAEQTQCAAMTKQAAESWRYLLPS